MLDTTDDQVTGWRARTTLSFQKGRVSIYFPSSDGFDGCPVIGVSETNIKNGKPTWFITNPSISDRCPRLYHTGPTGRSSTRRLVRFAADDTLFNAFKEWESVDAVVDEIEDGVWLVQPEVAPKSFKQGEVIPNSAESRRRPTHRPQFAREPMTSVRSASTLLDTLILAIKHQGLALTLPEDSQRVIIDKRAIVDPRDLKLMRLKVSEIEEE
jgi:hypothetical protein